MKSPRVFCLQPQLAALLATILLASLPAAHAAEALPDEASLHAELRQWASIYETAVSSGNFAPLEPLFSEDTTGVVVNGESFKSFAELKAVFEKFRAAFPGVVYQVTLHPDPSQIYGDFAVAHGTCDELVKTTAGEFTYASTWTAVLRRVDGKWKLVRSQMTMDPFGNSIVRFFVGKAKLGYGLVGLAVGAIVGLCAGRLLKKRPVAA